MSLVATYDNVSKTYKSGLFGRSGTKALESVSLKIPAGSVYALLGPNRAGKTTLVKLLLGLSRPTGGAIQRLGQPASDRRTLARVGYMHENQHFPRYLPARELLRFYASLTLMKSDVIPKRVDELLNHVGLADRAEEPISRFSKGMVQRLGLAQALLNDPDLLILDEPTEGLDLIGRAMLREIIAERKTRGKSVILVSHVLTEVEQTCDHVGVVVGGKLVREAAISDLLTDPKTRQPRSLESVLRPLYEGRGS
ncbi:ABC transporter ATP-binding protein [Zavarzinella formosa]|uniref:ABC transporter ATP-binding protein n=1 Tax=Zavarzinella formosa TaxID=360055 RepID=UPI00031837DB|nr:ABC transporter ATP-binding protein [Zavarzinella formosa]